LTSDPIADSLDLLLKYIDGGPEEEFQYKPYRGYGIQHAIDEKTKDFDDHKEKSFLKLLNDHVNEAMQHGFDDSVSKYRSKNHFVRPPMKIWYESFKFMHTIFIENPKNSSFAAKDPDYVSEIVKSF
jgi:protein SMG8